MKNFINPYSYKCLLGQQTKTDYISRNLYIWQVNSKMHFACSNKLELEDIEILKTLKPISFHYLSSENLEIIKNNFKITKSKELSIGIDIKNLEFKGRKHHGIRNSINKCAKLDLEVKDNYNNINDVKTMLNEWSNILAQKYFRDFSGKNLYFYKNNFHKDCINVFIYKEEELISFASASPPVDGCSTYIIGKALCNKYAGLSEYTDLLLYNKLKNIGCDIVNMGQATKGLVYYKAKFPNSIEQIHYNGKIL